MCSIANSIKAHLSNMNFFVFMDVFSKINITRPIFLALLVDKWIIYLLQYMEGITQAVTSVTFGQRNDLSLTINSY